MKTSNPALSANTFRLAQADSGESMTISGAVNKTGILLICAVLTAAWSWNRFTVAPETAVLPLMIGAIGGFIVALVTIFKKEWAPVTAPLYALLEGLVLGSVSAMYEARFHGIAIQAVGLTFGTLVVLLLAYRAGVIRATEKFKLGVIAATGGIATLLSGGVCAGVFRSSLCCNQWIGRHRNRRQCVYRHHRRAEFSARLRLHRKWRALRSAQIHGVVRGLRPDGHA